MEVLKRLQTSVARAFDESFDDAYRHLNADLALRDAKVSEAELAHDERMKALAKVEELERDISALQTELRQYTNGMNDVEDSVTMTKDLLHQAYAPEHVLADTVDGQNGHSPLPKRAVEAKYRALYSDAQKLAEANNRLKTEHARRKTKLLRLQQYIGRDEFTVVLDGGDTVTFRRVQRISNGVDYKNKKPRISKPNAGQLGPSDQRSEVEASTKKSSPSTRIMRESNGSELRTNVANDTDNDHSIRLNSDQLDLASTQSGDSSGPEGAVLGHSSGAPIAEVLHVRKRKRTPLPESRHMHSHLCDTATNESSERPVFIKSESVSPGPLQSPLRDRPLISAGTQDLDDIGVAIGTPEKRAISTHRTPFSPRDIPMPTSDLNDSDHHSRGQQQRIDSEPSKRPTVLQPIDSNAQALNRFDCQTDFKKRKVLAIPSITEDGDESYLHFEGRKATSMLTHNRELEQLSAPSTIHQRLENLLNGPSPSKSPLPFPKSPKGLSLPPHSHDGQIGRDLSIQHNISTSSGATTRPVVASSEAGNIYNPRRINVGNELPDMVSEDKGHRSGLTHRLDLSDFRVNPAKNQGLDFPYKSVVRKKDERKCLPGCVSEDCCGPKFRRIARSLPCTEDEARKIVEDYLGDERHILARISDDERERIFLDARAWSLANRYGRHRKNHQRAPSPPGFWRTEMPDTQELRHDREEAEKIEQETIMARRREAMRPGGLWEFADQ
ncbi:hypothetical protein MPDQ_003920 [Monascus purpureus]|uniref:DNA endonuclease activator Ctp1 C-terminal domain-containing protein n=1 Tax=Monascus purpureus TaxID=5098 RepID=A0A507QMC5_MONPU|nr:hypothetical protein MPDQ_003920 [Monascus purpureus]BDD57961.1 hypothetical protein MAP00_003277 [Monascus purpureus]